MGRNQIIYATKTKHSKKIAEAIGLALGIPAQNINGNPEIKEAEHLFIVGGIYGGESSPEMLNYVKNLNSMQVKQAVLITSCASNNQGQDSVRKMLQEKNIAVTDEFICLGSFLLAKMGHPNQEDIQAAVTFSKKIVE